jgi:hypothetical protein
MLLDSVVRGFASLCVAYMMLCSSFAVVSLVRVSRAMGGVYGGASTLTIKWQQSGRKRFL